jgi:hypothetical protein
VLNNSGLVYFATPTTYPGGLYINTRTNSTNCSQVLTGNVLNSAFLNSVALTDREIYILDSNGDGTAEGNEPNYDITFAFVSAGLTLTECTWLDRCVHNLMISLGAQFG